MLLLAIDFDNLHQILQNLYVEMMPLCSKMTGVARGLAGLGALFYVAYRVWQVWHVPSLWMSFRFCVRSLWGFVSCSFRHSFWVR